MRYSEHMHNDVSFAALRAAARVAFGVVVLGGCSGAREPADEASATESGINEKKEPPCHEDAAKPEKPSCDAVLVSAFADAGPDDFVWNDPSNPRPPVSAEVKACCEEKLTAETATWNIPYRWSCCAAIDNGIGNPKIGTACTPWGPPVPPSMMRRRTPPRGIA